METLVSPFVVRGLSYSLWLLCARGGRCYFCRSQLLSSLVRVLTQVSGGEDPRESNSYIAFFAHHTRTDGPLLLDNVRAKDMQDVLNPVSGLASGGFETYSGLAIK